MKAVAALALLAGCAMGKVYFQEKFEGADEELMKKWVQADAKVAEGTAGKLEIGSGKWYEDKEKAKGLMTTEDARFYLYTAEIPEEFSNKDKKLILQYTLKQDQKIDCGGGYLKLIPKDAMKSQKDFTADTKYNIMFGPDICGSTHRTHVIFEKDGSNHLVKKEIKCETDEYTHLYTLIVNPDNTYEVKIDNKSVRTGNLEEDWDMVPPKEIKDPKESKPADWVDDKEIDDPEDKKPEGWDDIPERIVDPNAEKPEDWDDETDGEWEAPTIPNPEYKGEWKPKKIPNPAYKGEWVHPMIPNPDYKPRPDLYAYESFAYVGIEIWQVKSGSVFKDILITDEDAVAAEFAERFEAIKAGEKAAKEAFEKKVEEVVEQVEKAADEAEEAEEEAPKEEL